ncbi:MAG: ImmA/IrrE family metallo-endopeptidase [Clostridium sp.]|uniref:ImmA/IrrE family metallo-endopeptidase n=1 Tax=Clostridium sp. DSM 8431 TaxID=1761781 RepID=UPI0008F29B75|nr:ImmA/IrrE family metallo-endopeptidase [Clostridium sp. DSM 8431]MCR4944660.1 ImmA/IrrE family metallo-endopeptidase [Clostridium sp.]SFU45133.1 protein of unknown function [Clostridium sp. DSM 8431]
MVKSEIKKIIKSYGTSDVFTIYKSLGLWIYILPLGKIKSHYIYKKKRHVLFINSSLSINEQIFLCTIMLGHIVLHKRYKDFSTIEQKEAEDFALEFIEIASK